jgi:hypothetical protein
MEEKPRPCARHEGLLGSKNNRVAAIMLNLGTKWCQRLAPHSSRFTIEERTRGSR